MGIPAKISAVICCRFKIIRRFKMITAVVFAAATAYVVGKVFFGSGIYVAGKYFMFKALGAGVTAPHTFIGLQGVLVHNGL